MAVETIRRYATAGNYTIRDQAEGAHQVELYYMVDYYVIVDGKELPNPFQSKQGADNGARDHVAREWKEKQEKKERAS